MSKAISTLMPKRSALSKTPCQKVLGGWANIANEYATKRYRSNLINWGMLPFLYKDGDKNIFTNRAGKKVLVAQTGRYGRNLGKITIDLDNIDSTPKSEIIAINSRLDSRSDGSVERFLKPYTVEVDKLSAVVIGRSEAEYPNGEMNPLSNWVADKILEIGKTLTDRKIDFAVGNKGGVRRPLTVGDVTMGQMLTMLPFENYVTVIELTGKDVAEAFNSMAARDGDAVSAGVSARTRRPWLH